MADDDEAMPDDWEARRAADDVWEAGRAPMTQVRLRLSFFQFDMGVEYGFSIDLFFLRFNNGRMSLNPSGGSGTTRTSC